MAKKNHVIQLTNIHKSYTLGKDNKVKILKGVNLSVSHGEFVILMGPSGSGKSTLMNILGCLDVPDEGEYILNSQTVSGLTSSQLSDIRNLNIGFIFQSFNLLSQLTALQNVSLPSFYAGKEDLNKAKQLLEKVGLGDRIDHKPNELSGGQKQRVAIARSLMNNPQIIMADEPTGNLDSTSSKDVMHLLKKLHEEDEKTIILVTHDDYTASFGSHTVILRDGLIEQ